MSMAEKAGILLELLKLELPDPCYVTFNSDGYVSLQFEELASVKAWAAKFTVPVNASPKLDKKFGIQKSAEFLYCGLRVRAYGYFKEPRAV